MQKMLRLMTDFAVHADEYFVHCSLLGQEDMWLPRLTKQTN